MNMKTLGLLVLISISVGLTGCTASKSFTTAARAGDTVALAVGWNASVTRANLNARITPNGAAPIDYAPGNANIRALINTYPDPMSRLMVGTETNQSLGVNANIHGAQLNSLHMEDKDLAQTMVFINLPAGIPPGLATIQLKDGVANLGLPFSVEVLSGTGSANTFDDLSAEQLATLERTSGSVVTFSGATVPHSISFEVPHALSTAPWVVNPRGDIKNVAWSDNGTSMKVILTPVSGQSLSQLIHFKFFISGVSGFGASTVKAYDVNGNLINGIGATITAL